MLPSLPVPEMTMASGAGFSWAESHTRSLLSNQNTAGIGRRHGRSRSISSSGTLSGSGRDILRRRAEHRGPKRRRIGETGRRAWCSRRGNGRIVGMGLAKAERGECQGG